MMKPHFVHLLTSFVTVKGIELRAGQRYEVLERGSTYCAIRVWQTGEIVDFAHSEVRT